MMRSGNSHAGRANLTKYMKLRGAASERWRFCLVIRTGDGRIRPDYVLIDGRQELHKEGAYYIEWYLDGRRYRESVGKNASEAFASAERKAQVLRNQALGIEIVGEDKQTGVTLAEACRESLRKPGNTTGRKPTASTRPLSNISANRVVKSCFVVSNEPTL